MQNFSDITNLYEIVSIGENHYEMIIDNTRYYVYAFKVCPAIILNSKDKYILEMLNKYEEFLRTINLEFQILIINKKINGKDYFLLKQNESSDDLKTKLTEEYINNLDKLLNGKDILNYEYYLIIKSIKEVENVEKYILSFETIGINVEYLNSKEELQKLIIEGGNLL